MMRGMELFVFVLCINLSIGFINALPLFEDKTLQEAQSEEYGYTIQSLEEFNEIQDPSIVDYGAMLVTWVWESTIFLFKFVLAFVWLYPALVEVFYIPEAFSLFLQGGLYVMWVLAIIQWKSGKSLINMA